MLDDRARKFALIVGLAIVALVGVFVLPSFGSTCGDYDRADAEDLLDGTRIEQGNDGRSYEYEPGDGDYRKTGPGEFEYVGCSGGSGGFGFWSVGSKGSGGSSGSDGSGGYGSGDSDGSGGGLFRGGGPGSGK
ncbi:hypothetical protein [Streptomonospora wellingtoniae]|uniref:Uncharacterized protein n=1 Tax=Streptomonospora wellingtoniae TaxID=3075544 RepID=A0ABU2KST3_9ACTN|nr:hypothetical protein [Streptomonospora sp. DSM 45055]MDT0302345.1 hypothetical protein [Streptomonospora sp. DSM 45055]